MLALEITSQKIFMNQLLNGDAFDVFLLEEATVKTAATYTIDGYVNKEFYSSEELSGGIAPYDFMPWSDAKGLCFQLIKGKHTPLLLKLVLHLKPAQADKLLEPIRDSFDVTQVKSPVLTVKYDGSHTILTTAVSYHSFVMSKDPDFVWDKALMQYLERKEIPYQVL